MYKIAVLGATGAVGKALLSELAQSDLPYNKVFALASRESSHQQVSLGDLRTLSVQPADFFDFCQVDIVFSAVTAAVIKTLAPRLKAARVTLIDNSSYFRMKRQIPLVIPEVNAEALNHVPFHRGCVVANPNCIAIPLSMTLKALTRVAPLEKIVVSTYQSVSGVGQEALSTLYEQTRQTLMSKPPTHGPFDRQIAFNVIPFIGAIDKNGRADEEKKIQQETQKILSQPLKMAVTAVRVPVFVGHSMSVNVTFQKNTTLSQCKHAMTQMSGVMLHPRYDAAVSPQDIVGTDTVHVCRLRKDATDNDLNYWVVSDNMRKGAAQNAVQIAQRLHHLWGSA